MTSTAIVVLVVLVVGVVAWRTFGNPNAAADAWAAGRANATVGEPFGYRWDGTAWVRT